MVVSLHTHKTSVKEERKRRVVSWVCCVNGCLGGYESSRKKINRASKAISALSEERGEVMKVVAKNQPRITNNLSINSTAGKVEREKSCLVSSGYLFMLEGSMLEGAQNEIAMKNCLSDDSLGLTREISSDLSMRCRTCQTFVTECGPTCQ